MAQGAARGMAKLPELRKRFFFTLMMLAVYRLGVAVPTPGIDLAKITAFFSEQKKIFEVFNLVSAGALEQFSVFALGIMPYISASIIFQLLNHAVPALKALSKEGEVGRRKITQYTRYSTIALAIIQGFGISYTLQKQQMLLAGVGGPSFYFTTILTLTAGTAFLMWLGEQITERGIGNGISLIIFAGIVARIPSGLSEAWGYRDQFGDTFGFFLLLAFIFLIVAVIIYFERAQRRIPVHYARRVVGGRKMVQAQTQHLPLKLNIAGVIPPIFASSLLIFPSMFVGLSESSFLSDLASRISSGWLHDTIYVGLIIFFCFFYTAIIFSPEDISENLKKGGGYIPGIRPGAPTASYIDRVLSRLTMGGALYVATVCILPTILTRYFGVPGNLAFIFGGTSLLIMVGVAMDTLSQVESHLVDRNYDGFLGEKQAKFRGRRS